ncbi:MAG: TnpV protein [Eubacteriales bacterium]
MKKEFYNEDNGLWYQLGEGGLYYPQIVMTESLQRPLGKCGRMRKHYLEEERYVLFVHMLLSGSLYKHLDEVEEEAQQMVAEIVNDMAVVEGCDNQMKMQEQMKWVGLMNNYHNCAEEIVKKLLIYV